MRNWSRFRPGLAARPAGYPETVRRLSTLLMLAIRLALIFGL